MEFLQQINLLEDEKSLVSTLTSKLALLQEEIDQLENKIDQFSSEKLEAPIMNIIRVSKEILSLEGDDVSETEKSEKFKRCVAKLSDCMRMLLYSFTIAFSRQL